VSPTTKGLFQRAIVESGSYGFETTSLASAEAGGVAIASTVGCANQTAACLRAVPTAVLNAASSLSKNALAIDGTVLPMSLNTAIISGQFNRLPIIDGNNRDELRLFEALTCDIGAGVPATPAQYLSTIN
jgi:para-nitrobenzyl esterase